MAVGGGFIFAVDEGYTMKFKSSRYGANAHLRGKHNNRLFSGGAIEAFSIYGLRTARGRGGAANNR